MYSHLKHPCLSTQEDISQLVRLVLTEPVLVLPGDILQQHQFQFRRQRRIPTGERQPVLVGRRRILQVDHTRQGKRIYHIISDSAHTLRPCCPCCKGGNPVLKQAHSHKRRHRQRQDERRRAVRVSAQALVILIEILVVEQLV